MRIIAGVAGLMGAIIVMALAWMAFTAARHGNVWAGILSGVFLGALGWLVIYVSVQLLLGVIQ